MRVIIVESPAKARFLFESFRKHWSDEKLFFVAIASVNIVRASSPRSLPYSSYPRVSDPSFKPNLYRWNTKSGQGCFAMGLEAQGDQLLPAVEMTEACVRGILAGAHTIVCTVEWDASGVWAFDYLMKEYCPNKSGLEHPVFAYKGSSIACDLEQMGSTFDQAYSELLNAGLVKRYFEYNFNTNSLVIFGSLYRKLSLTAEPAFLSKYMVQVLLFLGQKGQMHFRDLELYMSKWCGTGKYDKHACTHSHGMGTPASRQMIISNLVDLGLVLKDENYLLQMSELGRRFVDQLHKDCLDPDLPFRIDAWMCKPFSDSKPLMDSYLRRFFGKQKRFG